MEGLQNGNVNILVLHLKNINMTAGFLDVLLHHIENAMVAIGNALILRLGNAMAVADALTPYPGSVMMTIVGSFVLLPASAMMTIVDGLILYPTSTMMTIIDGPTVFIWNVTMIMTNDLVL